MMFSPDSAIDGAVLEVILRKAEEIRKATGVTVPLPDERGPVTDALMASMMLRRARPVSSRSTCASMTAQGPWRRAGATPPRTKRNPARVSRRTR